ncbi:MAG: type II toxin-antitoxin system RelE/ParE family toxin [Cyanothece sp. SIO2G6]|nr:type II toxin-antitoxin system RelE/ParE family toxin [Cyanothece sp. SIO2G6]
MKDKRIYWIGSAKNDLSTFPAEARRKIGFQLRAVQKGQEPSDFKPMAVIGKGVEEIRVRAGDAYRVFYVARFEEAVYVLHAFQKKSQKTSKQDIELGQQRYREMLRFRQQEMEDSRNDND